MKIECDDCGEANDPGSSRCAACGSLLPVTLALDTSSRLEPVARGAVDYRQRVPSPPPAPARTPLASPAPREMPFEVGDDWDEDVFTSAPTDGTESEEPPPRDPPQRDAPPRHPVPTGPVAYVPGKGLVPRAKPPAIPPPTRGSSRARGEALKTTGSVRKGPVPEPRRAPPQEPTLVAQPPRAGAPDAPVGEIAALGAMFDNRAPVSAPRRGHSARNSTNTEVAIAVPVQSIKLARLDVDGVDAEVRVLELGRFLIGREDGDILLRDPTVSPWHAQISVRRNGVFLRDMRSLNGVFVRATDAAALRDGALVRVGGQTLRYRDRWEEVSPDRHGTLPLGGPQPPKATRVEVLGPGGVATSVRYIADSLLLGRTRGDLRFADDPALRPEHARFDARDGSCVVSPVAQARTFVQIDEEVELLGGAIFLVGDTVFRVDF